MQCILRCMPKGVVFLTTALAYATVSAEGTTISISCGAVGLELQICQEGAQAWAKATGNTVNVISAPNSASEPAYTPPSTPSNT